jgi:hypothetical protein
VIDEYFSGQESLCLRGDRAALGFTLLNEAGDMGQDPRDDLLGAVRGLLQHAGSAGRTDVQGRRLASGEA